MAVRRGLSATTQSLTIKIMDTENYPDGFDEERMKKVMKQQEAIRSSGMTNMFDVDKVQRIASDMGSNELVVFIDEASAEQYFDMAEEASSRFRV